MRVIESLGSTLRSNLCLLKFIFFIFRSGVFNLKSPEGALLVLGKFIELQWPVYSQKVVFSRSTKNSACLLQTLIKVYIDTKSDTVLNQILTVLKEEFIKRGSNGRK